MRVKNLENNLKETTYFSATERDKSKLCFVYYTLAMISPENFHVRMLCCYWSFITQRSEQLKLVILEIRQPIGHLNFLPRKSTAHCFTRDACVSFKFVTCISAEVDLLFGSLSLFQTHSFFSFVRGSLLPSTTCLRRKTAARLHQGACSAVKELRRNLPLVLVCLPERRNLCTSFQDGLSQTLLQKRSQPRQARVLSFST